MREGPRRCPSCGADLSKLNPSALCGPCNRTLLDSEILTARPLAAQAVIHVYTHPHDYSDPAAYTAALTRVLDALCEAYDVEPPGDVVEPFERHLRAVAS